MKKTMIALLALSGMAMAAPTALTLPGSQDNKGHSTGDNPIAYFAGYNEGVYMFNEGGKVETSTTTGEGIWNNSNGICSVVLAKRGGAGGSGEAIVLGSSAIETGSNVSDLSFSVGASSSENLTGTITLSLALLKGADVVKQSSATLTLGQGASTTLTLDKAVTWGDSYKIIALMNGANNAASITGSNGQLYTLSNITMGATTIPEPATATLSLLALAGLAARRRRH